MFTTSLDNLLSKVALLGGLSLFSYNCQTATPEPASCSKDTDCKGDRLCVQGMCQAQSTYEGGSRGSDSSYIWGVGNCELGYSEKDFMLAIQSKKYVLVRSFSKNEIDSSNGSKLNCYDSYICALNKEPNLFALKTDKGIGLVDNLFFKTLQKYPGKDECRNIEWAKPWYKDCFVKSSDCPTGP